MNCPLHSGLIRGLCRRISYLKKTQHERLNKSASLQMEGAIVFKCRRESGSAGLERGSEERTPVAGVLTEMAARGHQGQSRDFQRQAAFDQSNIFTIFGRTNRKNQNE